MSDDKPGMDETRDSDAPEGDTKGPAKMNGGASSPASIALGQAPKTGTKKDEPKDAPEIDGEATEIVKESAEPDAKAEAEPSDAGDDGAAGDEADDNSGSGGLIEKAVLVLVAAILGGAVVALVQRGLGAAAPGTDAALAQRVAALEAQLETGAAASGDPEALASLGSRFEAIESRLGAVEAAPPGGATEIAEGSGLERVNARFDSLAGEFEKSSARLAGRIDVLESTTPADLPEVLRGLVTNDTFAELQTRVDFLESNDVAQDARRAALAVALANLVRASSGSGAFANELDGLAILLPGDTAVAEIKGIAADGVLTEQMLVAGFNDMAREVLHAEARLTDEGWMVTLWRNLMAQFTVRPSTEQEGTDSGAILSRMEARLGEGNLAEAVSEGQAFEGAAAEAAAPWLRDAQTRVTLNGLISDVNGRVLQSLSE